MCRFNYDKQGAKLFEYFKKSKCLIYSPIHKFLNHFSFLNNMENNKWGDCLLYSVDGNNGNIKNISHVIYGSSDRLYNGYININREFRLKNIIYTLNNITFNNIEDVICYIKNNGIIQYTLNVFYDLGFEQKYKEPLINDLNKLNHTLYDYNWGNKYLKFKDFLYDGLLNFSALASTLGLSDNINYTAEIYLKCILFCLNPIYLNDWIQTFNSHIRVNNIKDNIVYLFFLLLYNYYILYKEEIKEVEITPLFAEYIEQEIGIHYNDNIDEILEYIKNELQNILKIFEEEFKLIK